MAYRTITRDIYSKQDKESPTYDSFVTAPSHTTILRGSNVSWSNHSYGEDYPTSVSNITEDYGNASTNANDTKNISPLMFSFEVADYFIRNIDGEPNGTQSYNSVDYLTETLNDTYYLNCTNCTKGSEEILTINYWAFIFVLCPIFTLFGNVLVILAVKRERTLQTVTNYFIVSLALADLLVAVVVMPFAVYVLVNNQTWSLPPFMCDFYFAMDVTCSTSSIFNLVAISIDRYIAVTKPIKYAKHKSNRRVWLTIAFVWAISAAIGSPIVLGLNNTPDRLKDHCLFYNSDFIIYSSLSSFYIPCIIMVFLYYNIFKALRIRAQRAKAARKPHQSDIKPGTVIENVAQTRRLAETALGPTLVPPSSGLEDDRPTNTGSGSQEEEDDIDNVDDCHVIPNDKSTEFILATVTEETAMAVSLACPQTLLADPNGNNDSGYAASNLEEMALPVTSLPNSPNRRRSSPKTEEKLLLKVGMQGHIGKNGSAPVEEDLDCIRSIPPVLRTESMEDSAMSGSKKEKKASSGSRFTIYKVNKASKKKREKSSAKKERKATKTLAIVLGVFLCCWVPFFSFNILDAVCTKLSANCNPGVTTFIVTTWLGYMNSFVNPIIYTIFNPEFRKAFKKIMCLGT